jgi:hypothetical protein
VPTPDPAAASNGHNDLSGVSCVARANCWAVGEYGASTTQHRTLTLHWNGSAWSQVSSPDPGGAPGAWFLAGVSCTSGGSCWAVGHHARPHGANVNLALHWTGTRWSWVPTPQPSGGHIRQLSGVSCVFRKNCWAVGSSGSGSEAFHWNGSRWSSAATPKVGNQAGVACTSVTSCWSVFDQVLRWTGSRWSQVPTPQSASKNNRLLGVGCARASECWAAGILDVSGAGGSAQLTDVLRWNGTTWARVASPNPGGSTESGDNSALNELDGAACGSTTRCWAVGSYWNYPANTRDSIILSWNGSRWSAS